MKSWFLLSVPLAAALALPLAAEDAATTGGGKGGGTAPPLTYNAITDLKPRPEPPLPALGPAGTVLIDSTFGSRILRVTDENTKPDQRAWSFMTSAGAFLNVWNADSTMFWVLGPGGAIPFAFDPAAMQAKRLGNPSVPSGGLILPRHGPFSYCSPKILYAANGLVVEQYDFATGKYSPIFDARKLKPELTRAIKRPYGYSPSVSDDDTRIIFAFGGYQDEYPYLACYDRRSGESHILDTQDSRIDGRPARIKLGYGMHSAYVDRTGRFVVIGKGQGRKGGQSEWLVWDTQANDHGGDVADIEPRWSGHEVSGFGWRVNQSGYYGGSPAFYDQAFWVIRPLGLSRLGEVRDLIDPGQIPTPHPGALDGHPSWHNARPDVLVPVIESTARDAGSKSPWRCWDNEIIGIRTDGVQKTVWRFAHHRSIWDGKGNSFWDLPRGNVSPNGRWFLFTSNWGKSLGTDKDPSGNGVRRDVFLVDLCSAGLADQGTLGEPGKLDYSAPGGAGFQPKRSQ